MRSLIYIALLLALTACKEKAQEQNAPLPYFGIHDLDENGDTLHYTIPKFSFVNQNGREVSHRDYSGKIFVADFFFTTCPSICPIMSTQMARLQQLLKRDQLAGDVMLLSHSINPEYDQPEVLKAYAERMEADTTTWNFVTGPRSEIYSLAKDGYFINALESDTAAGGFIHSDNFMLIDRGMHIRGYYDGTSTKEVDQLLVDIKQLIKEENGQ